MTAITRMQQKRGSTAQWTESNTILADGEIGIDTTLDKVKVGDGVTPWLSLPFFGESDAPPPITTMWFDYERGDNGGEAWAWTDPGWADQTRTVVPILHSAHLGDHPLTFAAGGLDGNSPAYLTPQYVGDDGIADAGLYHVEGLLVGSGYPTADVSGKTLKVFWNIGTYPIGTEEPGLELSNWGVEDYVALNGDVWTSRVSGDVILDPDRMGSGGYGYSNISSPWMSVSPLNEADSAALRAALKVMKVIITARRISSWPPKPA